MPRRALLSLVLLLLGGLTPASAAAVTVLARTPTRVTLQLPEAKPDTLYRVTYADGAHRFVWENLAPDPRGAVGLTDDKHLRPEYRLRAESRTSVQDPVVFSDFTKGARTGHRRLPFGVPVSSFGGPGYLVPGLSTLVRDIHGGFWLYLDHPPYALLKYDAHFAYRLALLLPDKPLAFDTDGAGNLWVLHPGNWLSKHSPLGEALGAWELPFGRNPGEFSLASGMAIDRENGFIYLSDEVLSRVQRLTLDLKPAPLTPIAWGWIGREDLAYTRAGQYDPDTDYSLLDRPRDLRLDGQGHLFVSCEHYLSKFDLGTGKQEPFGVWPVLGWGGSFSDSPFSATAATEGHWQRHYLAGVDRAGRIYLADRNNEFVDLPRLQVFSPEGKLEQVFTPDREVKDAAGARVYLGAVAGVAISGNDLWLTDAAGRVYASRDGLHEGGALFLGPGAAGRQFDLSKVAAEKFTVEPQPARVRHTSEGEVLSFPTKEESILNCEREGVARLPQGARSMWLPARLGEPFTVQLTDADGRPLPESSYTVEYEETPGAFGTHYDFFRVTNQSGQDWTGVKYLATARE